MASEELQRLVVELGQAETSEIERMTILMGKSFLFDHPKLAQVMFAYPTPTVEFPVQIYLEPMVRDILSRHLGSEYNKFMIAFDIGQGSNLVPGCEIGDPDKPMCYGWISLGLVPQGARMDTLAASDLSVYALFGLLQKEARNWGNDPRELDTTDPRFRLAEELHVRSREGQARYVADSHLVINTLALWPDTHRNSIGEMASELPKWAVKTAERCVQPIWVQAPIGRERFYREARFRVVESFSLDLNHYTPPGTPDMGMQEWVHVVYIPRSARLASSSNRDGWQ